MKVALSVLAALLIGFAATTWWALEWGGVAVIETRMPEGGVRSTHVWYAESGGELWLEAGSPNNAWFQDVRQHPVIDFSVAGPSVRYAARLAHGPSDHARIRSLMREKYGLRDEWVNRIVDTSSSVAVQLLPVAE